MSSRPRTTDASQIRGSSPGSMCRRRRWVASGSSGPATAGSKSALSPPAELRRGAARRPVGSPPGHLSTGCTDGCGNVDYSTFANCGIFRSRHPCGLSREAIHSLLRRARRGSRTKQHRKVVRGGSQGPKRKASRSCGRNRDRLGEFFFGPFGSDALARLRSLRCRFRPVRPVRRASTTVSSP